jgi:hypothetical protein
VELSFRPLDTHSVRERGSKHRLNGVIEEFFGWEGSRSCTSHEPVDLEHVPLMYGWSFDEGQEEHSSGERLTHDFSIIVQHLIDLPLKYESLSVL